MDENRPPIPPIDFVLLPAAERAPSDVDPAPMASAKSDVSSAVGWQGRFGQGEDCRNDPAGETSVAVYYRDGAEVRDGFLIALRAMGLADAERHSEPPTPPVGSAKW